MTPSNVARVLFVGAAVVLTAASAGSSQNNNNQNASMMQPYGQQPGGGGAPPPQQMEPGRALGLWQSNFGAVKIEADNSKGGIASGAVQGVWVYQRHGEEVIGYFSGNMRGNVMQFRWQEPGARGAPPLNGEGWLQFDTAGRQYSGRWWSDHRDRVGDWNGWRQPGEGEPQGDPQQPSSSDPYAQPGAEGGQYGTDAPSSQPGPSQPAPPPPPNDRRYY